MITWDFATFTKLSGIAATVATCLFLDTEGTIPVQQMAPAHSSADICSVASQGTNFCNPESCYLIFTGFTSSSGSFLAPASKDQIPNSLLKHFGLQFNQF